MSFLFSFGGIEIFTVPSKQALRRMLKIGEHSKRTKVSTVMKPLHLQTVLHMMMNDVLVRGYITARQTNTMYHSVESEHFH